MNGRDWVFLHGGQAGSWCWEPLVEVMNRQPDGGRLITLDMPGCGAKRDRDPSELTPTAIARELNREIQELGVKQGILVGHSLAGVLMPLMAAERPDLFDHLIYSQANAPREGQTIIDLVGSAPQGKDPERVGYPPQADDIGFFRAMCAPDVDEDRLAWLRSECRQDTTPPALFNWPVSREGYEPRAFDTTYVVALRDPLLPVTWQRRFAERLGCRQVVEIDTPHLPFISHPELLAETLRRLV